MTEATFIRGYTPERIGDALDLMQELSDQDVFMVVFRGMARTTHDELVKLHKKNFVSPTDRGYQNEVDARMYDLGWDIDTFAKQHHDPNKQLDVFDNVTYELLEMGMGIGMHIDMIPDISGTAITIPRGFGMSINLVSSVEFKVEERRREIYMPEKVTVADIDDLIGRGVNLDEIVGDGVTFAKVDYGDVVMWRQPQAHKVSVYETDRRGIAIIREDVLEAEDAESYNYAS